MMSLLCVKGFDICKCNECKIQLDFNRLYKQLSELNKTCNNKSNQYHNYLESVHKKLGSNTNRLRINSDYDLKSKSLWDEMQTLDSKRNKLIYRLNGLEKKADQLGIKIEVQNE